MSGRLLFTLRTVGGQFNVLSKTGRVRVRVRVRPPLYLDLNVIAPRVISLPFLRTVLDSKVGCTQEIPSPS